ncbi:EamA family transporter [Georgenia halophila]|uniref:EamA family transporter n=1 Tax=Georgenia halophila TaxID=620889 RepID=A0ABP8LB98_9MICO
MAPRLSARSLLRAPVVLVIVGICSVQFGAGIAKTLFDEASPTTLVWLRLAFSTLILLAVVRPRLRGRSRADWLVVIGFGLALGSMNWAIYQSFARIPIGIAVTIEFVGPLSIALFSSRRPRDLLWVLLAATGVLLLGLSPGDITAAGVGFALLAGAAWACYILLSKSTGARWQGLDGLAMASLVATLAIAPIQLSGHAGELMSGHLLAVGALVGLMSSVIPYSAELVALRSLRPGTFGILMSLEPAFAALAGFVIVSENLSLAQWAALACVVIASVGVTRRNPPAPAPN